MSKSINNRQRNGHSEKARRKKQCNSYTSSTTSWSPFPSRGRLILSLFEMPQFVIAYLICGALRAYNYPFTHKKTDRNKSGLF